MCIKGKNFNRVYFYTSIAGIVLTILVGLLYPSIVTSVKASGVKQEMSWGIGLWLTLIDYIVILILSIVDVKSDALENGEIKPSAEKINVFIQKINTKITRTVLLACIFLCYFLPFVKEYGLQSYGSGMKINYELQHTYNGFQFIGMYFWFALYFITTPPFIYTFEVGSEYSGWLGCTA